MKTQVRIEITPIVKKSSLQIYASLVYGDPFVAKIENGRMIIVGNKSPIRNLQDEQKLCLKYKNHFDFGFVAQGPYLSPCLCQCACVCLTWLWVLSRPCPFGSSTISISCSSFSQSWKLIQPSGAWSKLEQKIGGAPAPLNQMLHTTTFLKSMSFMSCRLCSREEVEQG